MCSSDFFMLDFLRFSLTLHKDNLSHKGDNVVDILQIQSFFFRAMLAGWANGAVATDCPQMSGHKRILFYDGAFTISDRYCVAQDGVRSVGSTTIWFQHLPVWVMHYGGQYNEIAIPLLKNALLLAYQRKQFLGGRGVHTLIEGSLVYYNQAYGDFAKFSGYENIHDHTKGRSLGYHEYWGMSLV